MNSGDVIRMDQTRVAKKFLNINQKTDESVEAWNEMTGRCRE
jgi:hypothetical protein